MKSFSCLVLFFLVFILSFYNSFSQDPSMIDSLKTKLISSSEDTFKVMLLIKMQNSYDNINPDSSLHYSRLAFGLSKALDYPYGMAISNIDIGICEEYRGNIALSRDYYRKGLNIALQANIKKIIAIAYNNLGISYAKQSQMKEAVSYFLKGAKIREELGYKTGLAASYINIGIMYKKQGELDFALKYFHKAAKIQKELGDSVRFAIALHNIGTIFTTKEEFEQSLKYFMHAAKLREDKNDLRGLSTTYGNIGAALVGLERFMEADNYYLKSIKIQKQVGEKLVLGNNLRGLGISYLRQKKYDLAINTISKSIVLLKELNATSELADAYLYVSQGYEKKMNYQTAHEYHKLYSALKDSIFNEQSAKSMNEMQAKYESEKKEKEIGILTKENELKALQAQQQEDQIKKQWYLILGIVFVLGLLISLIYVVHSQLKFKKEANKELEEMNMQMGIKNKSIAESINYAQRIQETIMPTQKHLQEVFPESFIFYKAKDVVSGDFPWVMNNENNFFAAAVDCTGHGVPGAMMSMIGYFLLNDIIGGRKIHEPAVILEQLHEGIKHTLRQEENLESQDGMDIALCSINKETHEVYYAGAHRSLLWFHDGMIEEIRGNRFPVGGLQYSSRGKEIKFTNHTLQLKKGDSIFFYSDGLIDQIGGDKGRRFQNNQVKEIITENKSIPMDELRDVFNDRFNKWMGKEKQLDDVIMMGIKV